METEDVQHLKGEVEKVVEETEAKCNEFLDNTGMQV